MGLSSFKPYYGNRGLFELPFYCRDTTLLLRVFFLGGGGLWLLRARVHGGRNSCELIS